MRKRLLIALSFSIVSVICGYLYVNGVTDSLTGGRKVEILVAAQEVMPGQRLTKEMLGVREIPEAYVSPDAIMATPAEERRLIGRPATVKLTQGQALLWSTFDVQRTTVQKLSGGVPRRQRAVTLPIDMSGGFAGMLRPGDHVDVIGTFSRGSGDSTTATILQNVAVLAVGDSRNQDDGAGGRQFSSVTLAVDLDEAELLMFAHQRGTLGYALRGDGDVETVTDIAEKSFTDVLDRQRRLAEYQRRSRPGDKAVANQAQVEGKP
jgi:pilus assembly protein CpaB